MNRHRYIIYVWALLWLTSPLSLWAQKGKGKTSPQPSVSAEQLLEQAEQYYREYQFTQMAKSLALYKQTITKRKQEPAHSYTLLMERMGKAERLLGHTEPIDLVDSIRCYLTEVPDKLAHLSSGRLRLRKGEGGHLLSSFETALGGQRIETKLQGDQLDLMRLYLIGEQWEDDSQALAVLNTPENEAFPYLMPDGILLFFAREAEAGLGGYDLYLSRLNWERNTFYEPTALGMPFNSPANDYLLAYDQEEGLGYLVSDRGSNEPGTVTIYRFRGEPRAIRNRAEDSPEPQQEELTQEERIRRALLRAKPEIPTNNNQ